MGEEDEGAIALTEDPVEEEDEEPLPFDPIEVGHTETVYMCDVWVWVGVLP